MSDLLEQARELRSRFFPRSPIDVEVAAFLEAVIPVLEEWETMAVEHENALVEAALARQKPNDAHERRTLALAQMAAVIWMCDTLSAHPRKTRIAIAVEIAEEILQEVERRSG